MSTTTAEPAAWTFPAFTRTPVHEALQLYTCPLPGRGLVSVRVSFDAGPIHETRDTTGVANLAAATLMEGTDQHSGEELGRRLEALGGSLGAGIDWDGCTLSGVVLAARWRELLEVAAEVAQGPAFPADGVERVRDERLNQEALEMRDPPTRSYEVLLKHLYSPGSRYALPLGGTRTTVAGLDRDAVVEFWRAAGGPRSIVVAGDVAPDQVTSLVSAIFSPPVPAGLSVQDGVDTPRDEPVHVVIVDRPGSAQSALAVGHVGRPRGERDEASFELVTQLFGGGGMLTTRLNRKIREEKGYTYGAYCAFEQRRFAGPVACRTTVDGAATVDAVNDIHQEARRFVTEGLEPGELETVRMYVYGGAPVRLQTPDAIAAQVAALAQQDLPDDHLDRVREELLRVEAPDVERVAGEELRPDRMVTVVAGDASRHRGGLEQLGIGPVTVIGELD